MVFLRDKVVIFNSSTLNRRRSSMKYEMPKSINRDVRTYPLLVEGANAGDHAERDVGNVLVSHFAYNKDTR